MAEVRMRWIVVVVAVVVGSACVRAPAKAYVSSRPATYTPAPPTVGARLESERTRLAARSSADLRKTCARETVSHFDEPDVAVSIVIACNQVIEERVISGDKESVGPLGSVLLLRCLISGRDADTCSRAVAVLRHAADAGDAAAMEDLGDAYASGLGVSKSPHAAVDWYTQAAAAYVASTQRESAFTVLEKALKEVPGHPRAQEMLAALAAAPAARP